MGLCYSRAWPACEAKGAPITSATVQAVLEPMAAMRGGRRVQATVLSAELSNGKRKRRARTLPPAYVLMYYCEGRVPLDRSHPAWGEERNLPKYNVPGFQIIDLGAEDISVETVWLGTNPFAATTAA